MKKKRVVVGLSGGVDSSVCAKLLIDQGYEVIGLFMKNWDDKDDPHCPAAVDAIDARNVAVRLGIPFYTVNFAQEYWDDVFEYFLEEHRKFRTPNPDILCNKYVKFKAFLAHAHALEADFIATGHYAAKGWNESLKKWELQVPHDAEKDQTYFLYAITQEALAQTIFPLQDLPKSEVRQIAQVAGFKNANKKDSTGICFIGERDYMEFLKKYIHQSPGDIVTEKGEIVGKHIGLSFYTLGQRKNLNIGGVKGYDEAPWFLLEKDLENNQLVVCQEADNPKLFKSELLVSKLNWITATPSRDFEALCKVRYRQEFQRCSVKLRNLGSQELRNESQSSQVLKLSSCQVEFQEPQRAITPGQSIVFYDLEGKVCLGGGEID